MSELSAQIPAALPSALQSQLQADITGVQAATTTSSNSISGLQSDVGSFNQVTLNSLSSYSSTFQTAVNVAESNNQALLTSYASLQTELNTLATEFPLLTILGTWYSALATLDQSLSSSTSALVSSSQTAATDLTSLETVSNSLQGCIQSSTASIEVCGTLVASISSIYSSEGQYPERYGACRFAIIFNLPPDDLPDVD